MSMPLVTLLEMLYFAHPTLMIDGVTISTYNQIEWMIQAGGLYKCSSLYCLQQTVLPSPFYVSDRITGTKSLQNVKHSN